MSTRITVYLPADLHKQVKLAAVEEETFVSDLIAKAVLAYLATGCGEPSTSSVETVMPVADKVEAATRTAMGMLREAGPDGIKVGALRNSVRTAGHTLGAADATIAALTAAGVVVRRGHRFMLARTDGPAEG